MCSQRGVEETLHENTDNGIYNLALDKTRTGSSKSVEDDRFLSN